MKYRRAGKSELELSVIGLGCWSLGGGQYWGDSNAKDEKELLHKAFDLGINYLDTAELYYNGVSETALGLAIKDLPREKLIIGSKLFPVYGYYDQAIQHCEDSLKRLGTDYLDIYMIHWPLNARSIETVTDDKNILASPPTTEETIAAMIKLREDGKIRHIGVSNFGIPWMQEFENNGIQPVVNQLAYNLFSRAIEYEVLPYCQKAGTGIIGYSVLMQGLLTGKFKSIDDMPPHFCRTRHFDNSRSPDSRHNTAGYEDELMEALNKLFKISEDSGIELSELSISWAVQNEALTSVLAGTRNPERLEENVNGAMRPLSNDLYNAINEAILPVKEAMGPCIDYYQHPDNDRTTFVR